MIRPVEHDNAVYFEPRGSCAKFNILSIYSNLKYDMEVTSYVPNPTSRLTCRHTQFRLHKKFKNNQAQKNKIIKKSLSLSKVPPFNPSPPSPHQHFNRAHSTRFKVWLSSRVSLPSLLYFLLFQPFTCIVHRINMHRCSYM